MPRSIRSRLTLWLSLLIALCMIAFALFLYIAVREALTGDLERTLRVQAQQVAASFDFGAPEAGGDGTGQHVDIGAVDQFASTDLFVETFDARGRLLARSSNLGHLHLPGEARATALIHAVPHFATVAVPGGALRVYSVPAIRGGRTVGLVLIAASLHTVTSTTRAPTTRTPAGRRWAIAPLSLDPWPCSSAPSKAARSLIITLPWVRGDWPSTRGRCPTRG